VRPICSSHLLQLLGPLACAYEWKGRHGAGVGHKAMRDTKRAWATVGAGHKVARATVRGARHSQRTRSSTVPHMKQAQLVRAFER
jgi:hypothetical protein